MALPVLKISTTYEETSIRAQMEQTLSIICSTTDETKLATKTAFVCTKFSNLCIEISSNDDYVVILS